VGPALARRFGGIARRIPLYAPAGADLDRWDQARRYLQDTTGDQ
jgi:hypothetical protein